MKRAYQHIFLKVVLFVMAGFIVAACAKIGSPYGGPKDEDPPRVLKTDPPDSSVNFVPQRKITITFDEFIQLKDARQEIMLSPPVEGDVSTQINGKKLVVEFPKDVEFRNTTYTLSFGNAIVDNNEGNILENYEYIFSLKDYIDTLSVEGRLVNAFNHVPPEEKMFVMLYKNLSDTAPLTQKPFYASRTNKTGEYMLHNLEPGDYRIFALKDLNNNMLFDLPEEEIAFSDTLISLNPEDFQSDYIIRDSTLLALLTADDSTAIDSSQVDSLRDEMRLYTLYTELYSFQERTFNQYMTDDKRERAEKLFISFNEPLFEPLQIRPLDYPYAIDDSSWYVPDVNEDGSTWIYWVTDTSMIASDSLVFELAYHVYDSLNNYELKTDTLLFRYFAEEQKEEPVKRGGLFSSSELPDTLEEKAPTLSLKNNIDKPGAFDLNNFPVLFSDRPLGEIRPERVEFYVMEDTIPVEIPFEVERDSNSLYSFYLEYEPEELTTYRYILLDSAATDIYGLSNDTIKQTFKTQALDFYGVLVMHLSNVKYPTILQLLNEKEEVLRQEIIASDESVRFEYLPAKAYKLKVIIDENNNRQWDTGNYIEGRQPERVEYYATEINIRANWEIEMNWELKNP